MSGFNFFRHGSGIITNTRLYRWHARCLFIWVFSLSLQTLHGYNGAIAYAYPIDGISIDGNLGDWPSNLTRNPIARIELGAAFDGKEDFASNFRVGYNIDQRAIYIAVEVFDQSMVIDTSSGATWNTQDGIELYLDAAHIRSISPVIQFSQYGRQRFISGYRGSWDDIEMVMSETSFGRIYEWRVNLNQPINPNQSLGMDLAVIDKDEDGSFSWVAWGKGTQKVNHPDRCGDLILLDFGTEFGEVSGKIGWKENLDIPIPGRIVLKSPWSTLWMQILVDSMGNYSSLVPVGVYTVSSRSIEREQPVVESDHIRVNVQANQHITAEPLLLSLLPGPKLIGDEGILHHFDKVKPEQIDHFVQSYMEFYNIPGVSIAIVKDAKMMYHRTFGVKNTLTKERVDHTTLFEAASISKPIFAFAVNRLAEKGVIDLDTPLYKYLPYEDIAHDERYKLITARHVLSHQTGFPNWRSINEDGKLDIKFTPGTKYGYSGEGFEYLGKVVSHVSKKSLEDVLEDEVFKPLSLQHTFYTWNEYLDVVAATGHIGRNPTGKWQPEQPVMAASMHTEAATFTNFMIGLINGAGLSRTTYQEMLKPQVEIPPDSPADWKASFGLGIYIEESPYGMVYGHGGNNGNFQCNFEVYMQQKMGYVFFANNDRGHELNKALRAYLITGKSD